MEELVSVVMTVYNEEVPLINEALQSLFVQTYWKKEIIVIVDNPEHNSAINFLRGFGTQIRLYINEDNIGLAASLNKGITLARGNIIARMDSDDICFPNRIEKEVNFLIEGNYDLVSSDVLMIDDFGNVINSTHKMPKSSEEFAKRIKFGNCLVHPTFMFTKALFYRLGGYKEELLAAQDYEFIFHTYSICSKIGFIQEPLLKYRVRSNSISSKRRINQLFTVEYTQKLYKKGIQYDSKYVESWFSGKHQDYYIFKKEMDAYFNDTKDQKRIKKVLFQMIYFLTSKHVRNMLINGLMSKIYIRRY